MELNIQSIHFDASEKLQAFIQKKVAKLEKNNELINKIEVALRVTKPETALNKETKINITVPGTELHAEKVCDTFEEGIDLCLDALARQLVKYKEKLRSK